MASAPARDRYRWTVLANTTAAVFMSQLDGSIVLIALPAIFRAIHLDPLAADNIGYLLWMIMGYRLVQAVLVVTVGRLGDIGLLVLPVDFPYPAFAGLLALIGVATGMFASPNSSSIMGSVPGSRRGVASGMRATFQNSGTALSIGVFFTLVIAGVASTLPHALGSGLIAHGVPAAVVHRLAGLPPVSSLFGALLGVNPLAHLLASHGVAAPAAITSREYFPRLISAPFHQGLVIVVATAAGLSLLAALASLARGKGTA